LVEAVDIKCSEGDFVYAPFEGELSFYHPFGTDYKDICGANEGIKITGLGQWRGYHALISTVKSFKFGGKVSAGEKIGQSGNLDCALQNKGQWSRYENFVRFQLFRHGQPIDPTSHLVDCMCTGQICESNGVNALLGRPFKYDSRYNGIRGYELKCSDIDKSTDENESTGVELIGPKIYSPIDGNLIGRIRVDNVPGESYTGCENEGIFIVGTGKWMDYEVRIFNARFRENLGLGEKHVEQGQHIGYRLNCKNSPESIFVEVRFQGALIDIIQALNASDCRHQKKYNKLQFTHK